MHTKEKKKDKRSEMSLWISIPTTQTHAETSTTWGNRGRDGRGSFPVSSQIKGQQGQFSIAFLLSDDLYATMGSLSARGYLAPGIVNLESTWTQEVGLENLDDRSIQLFFLFFFNFFFKYFIFLHFRWIKLEST